MTRELFSIGSLTRVFSRTASPARRPVRRFAPSLACDGLETRLAPTAMPIPFGGAVVSPSLSCGAFLTFTGTNGDGSPADGGATDTGTTDTGTGTGIITDTGAGTGIDPGIVLVGPDSPTDPAVA